MKKLLLPLLFALLSLEAYAATPEKSGPVKPLPEVRIGTREPDREVGYTVGDVLTRTITLEVAKPYQLVKTSLPIVGYEKRYKGQVTGIELVRSSHVHEDRGDYNRYVLRLSYQVFTNNVVAKPASLPAEVVQFSTQGHQFDFRIPSWSFRISPIAVFGSVNVEKDMSPLRGPFTLDPTPHRQLMFGLLGVLALSLLGLVYVFGVHSWLPRMGGPFARAYRTLRKLPDTPEGLKSGVTAVHEALNRSAGSSVFNTLGFLESKAGFLPVAGDLDRFFRLSRHVFFEPTAAHGLEEAPLAWLRRFCLACRHCERGLK